MKYLLTPFTLILWFLITYYGIYYSIIIMGVLFSLKWYWFILSYSILIGFTFGIIVEIPNLLRIYILKLFNFKWLFLIAHSLSGLLGVVLLIYMFNEYDFAHYVYQGEEISLFKSMWLTSKIKFIILFIPFSLVVISILYSSILIPVLTKLELIRRRNNRFRK